MQSASSGPLGDLWNRITGLALTAGAALLVLAVGYVAYGLFVAHDALFGALQQGGAGPAAYNQALHNMKLAGMALTVGAVCLAVGVLARYWMFPEAGVGLVTAGLAFFFGMPFLVRSAAQPYESARGADAMVELLVGQFTLVGAVLLGVGGIQLLVHTALVLLNRAGRRPRVSTDISQGAFTEKQKMERRDQFLGPCWTLPFCRDSAKRVCPVLNRKRPCWVDGRGCYCDQNIVLMLSGDRGGRVPGRGSQSFVPMQSLSSQRQKTRAEKRTQCLGCPIYLHRQNQKYKAYAPSVIAAVLAVILVNKPWLDEAYPETILSVGRALRGFSLGGGADAPAIPTWATDLANQNGVEWMLLLIAAFLMVGYLLHGVEWALYKLGI